MTIVNFIDQQGIGHNPSITSHYRNCYLLNCPIHLAVSVLPRRSMLYAHETLLLYYGDLTDRPNAEIAPYARSKLSASSRGGSSNGCMVNAIVAGTER